MPKQVFKICFFVFFSLSSAQIFYPISEENKKIFEAPKYDQPSTPSLEYTKYSSPEDVEETEFFFPERYPLSSPPPVSETLNIELADDDYDVFLDRAAVHEIDDYNLFLNEAQERAPSIDFETKPVFSQPDLQPEAEDYKAQVKVSELAPLQEVILPGTDESSFEFEPEADDDYNFPTKTSVFPAPSIAIPSTEMDMEINKVAPSMMALDKEVGVSPMLNPFIFPTKAEDADTLTLESDHNIDYNSTTENLESVSSMDSSVLSEDYDNPTIITPVATSPEQDMESTQVAPLVATEVDEDIDMPFSSNSVMPYTYIAEDETVDIVYEGNEGSWGSWAGQNSEVKVTGVIVGVCLIGLAGLVYNSKKRKKTELKYQPLFKGI